MKYINKKEIKETAINYYLEGKNLIEISKLTGCSRNYIGKLIQNDSRIKKYRDKKIVKVFKAKKQNKMNIPISSKYWEKIGISKDVKKNDYVKVELNENEKKIIITKYKK